MKDRVVDLATSSEARMMVEGKRWDHVRSGWIGRWIDPGCNSNELVHRASNRQMKGLNVVGRILSLLGGWVAPAQ
jgi:hypothetical protein